MCGKSWLVSVADVVNPSTNQRALSLLCGMDASQCTPKKWFNYLGFNSLAPFPINMTIVYDNQTVSGQHSQVVDLRDVLAKHLEAVFLCGAVGAAYFTDECDDGTVQRNVYVPRL